MGVWEEEGAKMVGMSQEGWYPRAENLGFPAEGGRGPLRREAHHQFPSLPASR